MEVIDIISKSAKEIFEKYPDLTSFGWQQWNTDELRNTHDELYTTIDKPDLNGNIGELLYGDDVYERQKAINEFLKQFDANLLRTAFGPKADITVYSDLSVEFSEYDPYRPNPYEL